MPEKSPSDYPHLRAVQAAAAETDKGERVVVLSDPEGLNPKSLLVPEGVMGVLALFDGRHSLDDIVSALGDRSDLALRAKVREMLDILDENLFLEVPGSRRRASA